MMISRVLIVLATMAISFAGVVALRRRVRLERLSANNEFAGFAYAIIGAIYGVYLAFTVVVVWEQFGDAEQNATAEAVHLSQVWRDVEVLPAQARDRVQGRLLAYADSVIDREWQAMATTGTADPETGRVYEDVWRQLYAARGEVKDEGDAAFFDEAVVQMNDLGMSRRLRLLSASAALPSIMWLLLIGGGVLTVGLTYLLGTEYVWVQATVTSAVTGLIVFSLLIVAALQHPFAGDVAVTPEAMASLRDSLRARVTQHGAAPSTGQTQGEGP
jgi:hypothetical protein